MKNIKTETTASLKEAKLKIEHELNNRKIKPANAIDALSVKQLRALANKAKKIMKGKTLKLIVKPDIPIEVTVCLTECGEVNWFTGEAPELLAMHDAINEYIGNKEPKLSDELNKWNAQLEKLEEELMPIAIEHKVSEYELLEAVCEEATRSTNYAPGFGIW